MKAAMMDSAPTPEVEAGTSQVSMSADGVIEVLQ
jgi:predicted secreted protein